LIKVEFLYFLYLSFCPWVRDCWNICGNWVKRINTNWYIFLFFYLKYYLKMLNSIIVKKCFLSPQVSLKYFGTQTKIFWYTIWNILVCNLIYFGTWSEIYFVSNNIFLYSIWYILLFNLRYICIIFENVKLNN